MAGCGGMLIVPDLRICSFQKGNFPPIGLTIPAVAVVAYALDKPLELGLNAQGMVLLVLTFVLSMLTFATGRTNILFGLVHLVVFAVFVFLVFVP